MAENHPQRKAGYYQCRLVRDCVEKVAWIPAKFAVVGDVLKIVGEHGWENGWVLANVHGWLAEPPRAPGQIRVHRANTGDSLPVIDWA